MLPSSQRLSRITFTALLSDPDLKVVFTRIGTLKYRFCDDSKGFSVVTSAKNQKSAVKRNTIRRQLYQIMSKSPYFTDMQAVLFLSKQSYDMSYEQLHEHLALLLKKTAQ